MKREIRTDNAPEPSGAYSQAIQIENFIFTAGQLPIDPESGEIKGETIKEQTTQALSNIQAVLKAAGATMADVVKTTVYLADMSLFPAFNTVYNRFFPQPKPARTTIGSLLHNTLIEIDVVAYVAED
jgi:2-iminobutanoate/2-iminopropanoate deaminase